MQKLLGQLGGAIPRPFLHAATLFLLISPVFCHAQCNQPVITSVTPNTWMAGKTYKITITGSGFDPVKVSAGNCGVIVQATNGILGGYSFLSIFHIEFVNSTEITATVALDASEPTDTGFVLASNCLEYVDAGCDFGATLWPVQIVAGFSATITDTGKIMDGMVKVKLVAPSGTSGDLSLNLNGENDTYSQDFSNLSPGSQKLDLEFDSVAPDIYSTADGTWNANLPNGSGTQSVNIPTYTLPKQ